MIWSEPLKIIIRKTDNDNIAILINNNDDDNDKIKTTYSPWKQKVHGWKHVLLWLRSLDLIIAFFLFFL